MECGKVSLAAMQVFAELVYTQNFFCDDKNVMKEVGELAVKFHLKDFFKTPQWATTKLLLSSPVLHSPPCTNQGQ